MPILARESAQFAPSSSIIPSVQGNDHLANFLGSFTWQTMAYAVWESIMLVPIIIFLLYFFWGKFNHTGVLLATMAASVYTVYIVHQTVLFALNITFLNVATPSFVKFFAVSLIGVPQCLVFAYLILKLPYAKRVLG